MHSAKSATKSESGSVRIEIAVLAVSSVPPTAYCNNGSTAAAVAYDCSGVYVETDY